jgi:hypothetical protein
VVIFVVIPDLAPIDHIRKRWRLQGFYDAGGGTRTPDTRIMISLRFSSAAGFEGLGDKKGDMSAGIERHRA